MRIQEIMNRKIDICKHSQCPKLIEITEPLIDPPSKRADLVFEKKVFNHFLEYKQLLGIDNVYKLRASRSDGLLKLDNGQMVLLEIKYALNWLKSCQARIQFENFLKMDIYNKVNIEKPADALIVFHHFSADWARKGKDKEQIGWENFYSEQSDLKCDLNIHIVQLTDEGNFIAY